MSLRLSKSLLATLAAVAGLSLLSGPVAAIKVPTPESSAAKPDRIVPLARKELRKRVSERRGNNVPRYRNGRGRIAPYSIRDQWCVAFATWIWHRAGFRDYLGADLTWRSRDGTRVAVQVTDISRWAKRSGHWAAQARPGYLVAYDFSHIGVVERVNRQGNAVRAIEGNKGDRVRRVRVPMRNVTGYISPTRLSTGQILRSIAKPDMIVPARMATNPLAVAVSSDDP